MIEKWKLLLKLHDWDITTVAIDPKQVTYDDDCPQEDRYFIGVQPDHDIKRALIYHDRELTEEDVIHELLHVRYPDKSEDWVNKKTSEYAV